MNRPPFPDMAPGAICPDCGDHVHNLGPGVHVCGNRGRRHGYGPGDWIQVGDMPDRFLILQVERDGSVVVKTGPATQWIAASMIRLVARPGVEAMAG